MKNSSTLVIALFLLVGCGASWGDLFGQSSTSGGGGPTGSPAASSSASGIGGAASASSAVSSSASVTSSAQASSSSGGGLFWASGVQTNLPIASLSGWTLCWSSLYSDTSSSFAQVMAACQGNKMLLACRPVGIAILYVAAMADTSDVTFTFPDDDMTSTHPANGVGWYMSAYSWGYAPEGDNVWKGPMDVVGIDPNTPGPDGDKRISWTGNAGQFWVGYRCGYDFGGNHPGFDYNYERVIFSAP